MSHFGFNLKSTLNRQLTDALDTIELQMRDLKSKDREIERLKLRVEELERQLSPTKSVAQRNYTPSSGAVASRSTISKPADRLYHHRQPSLDISDDDE